VPVLLPPAWASAIAFGYVAVSRFGKQTYQRPPVFNHGWTQMDMDFLLAQKETKGTKIENRLR
jgi:hypothetical protein